MAGLALWNQQPRRRRLALLPLHRRRQQQAPLAPLMQLPRVLGTSAFLAALSFEVPDFGLGYLLNIAAGIEARTYMPDAMLVSQEKS